MTDALPPTALEGSGASAEAGFFVVGLGASAGGLHALERFFECLPPDSGMAFVVVTHQHPGHTSILPELIGKRTATPVAEARNGVRLEPNIIYLPPPGAPLVVRQGVFQLAEATPTKPRLSIDLFFRSLAADLGPRAVGIVLSGTGTDGTEGLKAIKGEGGLTLAQDLASAEHSGMPHSAAGSGLVDLQLRPEEMPAQLTNYARGLPRGTPVETWFPDDLVQRVLLLVRQHTGHDFTHYKSRTIRRRLERRLRLHQLEGMREYLAYARGRPEELEHLFQDLLIGVTSFFRDPEAFEALKLLLEKQLSDRPPGYQVRAWVPACSTGEEAYSIAILIEEVLSQLGRGGSFQVFATDINPHAIEVARLGRYGEGIAVDLTPRRLQHCFSRCEAGGYQIRKPIRDRVVFAPQDLLKDPPFTRLDLVSCRNLLIYLETPLQRRVVPLLHYALKPGGLLLLGSSETLGGFEEELETLDKKWKIYRRRIESVATLPALPFHGEPHLPPTPADGEWLGRGALVPTADRLLLDLFAPACLLVTERGEIVYVRGRTGAYLEPAEGQARMNALSMAREGLSTELALLLRRAAAEQAPVERRGVRVRSESAWIRIDLAIRPVSQRNLRGLFLVSFTPVAEPVPSPARSPEPSPVEEELARTRENLQATVEELEASNEELRSTNEELQSTNEELQSTNEELETSKEELQSLNEELQTVNAELQGKLVELSRAQDDMSNLLNSTSIATLFLDPELRIKRFTPQARTLIKLIDSDVGRPLEDLSSKLEYTGFAEDVRAVLRTLSPRTLQIRSEEGGWYQTRILPYQTASGRLEGVVITFVEVTELQQAHSVLDNLVAAAWGPLAVLDGELRIVSANAAFLEVFRLSRDAIGGAPLSADPESIWGREELLRLLKPSAQHLEAVTIEDVQPDGGRRLLKFNITRLPPARDFPGRVVVAARVV